MLISILELRERLDRLTRHIKIETSRSSAFQYIYNQTNQKPKHLRSIKKKIEDILPTAEDKIFLYKGSIISIYGALEKFIEQTAREYIKMLEKLEPKNHQLPEKIKSNHLTLSMDLIRKIEKNTNISQKEKDKLILQALGNTHLTEEKSSACKLNADAYAMHTSNFRKDTINSIFSNMGIDSITTTALSASPLKDHEWLDGVDEERRETILQLQLKKLADTRNEISHGSFDDNAHTESSELIQKQIQFIRDLCETINEITYFNYIGASLKTSKAVSLGQPDKTFPKHSVIGYAGTLHHTVTRIVDIKIGDLIIQANQNGEMLQFGKIEAIKEGSNQEQSAIYPSAKDITIKISFPINSNIDRSYFVLKI